MFIMINYSIILRIKVQAFQGLAVEFNKYLFITQRLSKNYQNTVNNKLHLDQNQEFCIFLQIVYIVFIHLLILIFN